MVLRPPSGVAESQSLGLPPQRTTPGFAPWGEIPVSGDARLCGFERCHIATVKRKNGALYTTSFYACSACPNRRGRRAHARLGQRALGLGEKLAECLDVRGFNEVQVEAGVSRGAAILVAPVARHRHQTQRPMRC